MLSPTERKILEILQSQELVTKGELIARLQKERLDGPDAGIGRLRGQGYIDHVQSLGNCLVITKLGLKALKER